MFTTHRVRAALGILALGGALLTGCGGDTSEPGSTSSAPSSTAGSTGGSPGGDDTGESGSTSPSTAPASGPRVDTSFFSVNMPDGWKITYRSKDFAYIAHAPDGDSSSIVLGVVDTYGSFTTLPAVAKEFLRSSSLSPLPRRTDDSELAGRPAYHLTGPGGSGGTVDVLGLIDDGQHISVTFDLTGKTDARQAVMDAFLASWQWA